MISQQYQQMLSAKSVIRELAEYATARGQEIGYENVFDYSLGNPSVPVPEDFTRALVRLAQDPDQFAVHGYSPSLGIPSVRKKVAESLNRRFGMHYTADDIFMSVSAAGALAHAFRLVCAPGDEIVTFAPYFPEYRPYTKLAGMQLKVVPPDTETFQIDFEKFSQMLTEQVSAVLINTPNNPSGAVYSSETLERLAAIMEEKQKAYGHDIFLISDEPYREITFDGKEAPYVSRFYANTISCYSFSKSLSIPGERIGYVAVNPACGKSAVLVQMCGQISRGIGHNCPASIMQLAVAEVLDQTSDLSVYETNRNLLYDGLTKLGFSCVRPGGTFYMFPKAMEEDAVAFCKKALKYDLILVPGDDFGCPGYFRMAYCIDTDKVRRSLPAFERFVKEEYGK